jgi:hypothetical protein
MPISFVLAMFVMPVVIIGTAVLVALRSGGKKLDERGESR